MLQVHVALARITLSPSQCQHDAGSVVDIDGRRLHCLAGAPQNLTAAIYSGSVQHTPARMEEAAAAITQAERRVAAERAAAVARNESGCAVRGDCTEGMGVGNLTALLDAYLSLARYYDSVEGCSQQYARPALLTGVLQTSLSKGKRAVSKAEEPHQRQKSLTEGKRVVSKAEEPQQRQKSHIKCKRTVSKAQEP